MTSVPPPTGQLVGFARIPAVEGIVSVTRLFEDLASVPLVLPWLNCGDRHRVTGYHKAGGCPRGVASATDERSELIPDLAQTEPLLIHIESFYRRHRVDVHSGKRVLEEIQDHLLPQRHPQDRSSIRKCVRNREISVWHVIEIDGG